MQGSGIAAGGYPLSQESWVRDSKSRSEHLSKGRETPGKVKEPPGGMTSGRIC